MSDETGVGRAYSKKKMKLHLKLSLLASLPLLVSFFVFANTPGKHTVTLTWTASTTKGVTYNVYRGSAAGVCNGKPTPYATAITGTTYVDTNVSPGTYFYNVSAVGPTGESACDGETSVTVPDDTSIPPSGVGAKQLK